MESNGNHGNLNTTNNAYNNKVNTESAVLYRHERISPRLPNPHKAKCMDSLPKQDSNIILKKVECHPTEYYNLMKRNEVKVSQCYSESVSSETLLYDEKQCPICFESEFQHPILLPCSHTFCFSCLSDFINVTRSKESFQCPMCREHISLSEKGIHGFLENYFVRTKNTFYCEICEGNVAKIPCKDCKKSLCTNCLRSHKCKTSQRTPKPDGNNSRSPLVGTNVPVPRSFHRPGTPWTKIVLNEITSFRLEGYKQCLAILPVSSDVWIINRDLEDITLDLFDRQGRIKQTLLLQSMAHDIAAEKSGSLLVTFPNENVVRRFYGDEFSIIFNSLTFCPLGIAVFQDGSFLLSGGDVDYIEKSVTGKVQYLSESGIIRSHFTTGSNDSPYSIKIINSDLICLGYPIEHYVEVRFRNGTLVAKYVGNNPYKIDGFTPRSLAVGCYGHSSCVFISDSASDTIHVISPEGKFMGLALRSETAGYSVMGQPASIAVDSKRQLWVGRRDENMVSLYEINEYSNVFD